MNSLKTCLKIFFIVGMAGCGVDSFDESSEDEDIELTNEAAAAISYGTISTTQGVMKKAASFSVSNSMRYTTCLVPTQGDPDLYLKGGGWPSYSSYSSRSQNGGLTADCIWFDTVAIGPNQIQYFGVYGYASGTSSASLWSVSAKLIDVPASLANNKLTWPAGNYKSLVNSYSAFGSPWGNPVSPNIPFFPGSNGMIHSGVDISVPPNTTVTAACNGVVKLNGDAGAAQGWGYYSILECNSPKVTIGYVHLNNAGRPALGAISVGQSMGTVLDMNVSGEGDHLHLNICVDSYDNCVATGNKPSCGRLKYDGGGTLTACNAVFPGKFINPFIGTNPGIWK